MPSSDDRPLTTYHVFSTDDQGKTLSYLGTVEAHSQDAATKQFHDGADSVARDGRSYAAISKSSLHLWRPKVRVTHSVEEVPFGQNTPALEEDLVEPEQREMLSV